MFFISKANDVKAERTNMLTMHFNDLATYFASDRSQKQRFGRGYERFDLLPRQQEGI